MSGVYGQSFASKLLEEEKYEEAIEAATKAIAEERDNPEHYFERGSAASMLERFDDAVADFERARELDGAAGVLDDDILDDSYFSALLGSARALPADAGVARLGRYHAQYPSGRHATDADDWILRLRGEKKSEFVKRRLDD